jgi:hypothetical protein
LAPASGDWVMLAWRQIFGRPTGEGCGFGLGEQWNSGYR